VDFTIADFVADRRAPTPTAAAEMVVPRLRDVRALVERGASALANALARRTARERRHVELLTRRLRDPRRRAQDLRVAADALAQRLDAAAVRRLAATRTRLAALAHRLAMQHPGRRAARLATTVAAHERRLGLAARRAVATARDRVGRAAASLDDLSPLAVLRRGYSLVRRLPEREIVRAADALAPGDAIEISFAAGAVRARVEKD
jgi:exodeoxyribonuclease VII large subunit